MKVWFPILVVVCMLFLSLAVKSQGTWEKLDIPTDKNLLDLHFNDSLTGWVVGDSGLIMHTNNGGQSWEIQESNIDNNIITVFFLDNEIGWASALNYTTFPYGSILLKTNNGGQTWSVEPFFISNVFINSIVYLDSLTGWMGGSPHLLVRTMDGGSSWHPANIDTSTLAFFPVLNIEFLNDQYGYASGGMFDIAGVIWSTNNGGDKWYAISTDDAPADEVHGLYLFDTINVIGSGGDPDFGYGVGMIRTTNGGDDWEYDEIGVQGIAYDVDFVNDKEGWAALGTERKFVYSMDAGETWEETNTPDFTSVFKIDFTDSLVGYAVGYNGAFLKYKASTSVGINQPEQTENIIELEQNYPNPFNNKTKIKIRINGNIQNNDPVVLHVYNQSGVLEKSISIKSDKNQSCTVELNTKDVSAGILYYQVQYNNRLSGMKKMVLIK